MNKRQLMVLWVAGLAVCAILLLTPHKYVWKTSRGTQVFDTKLGHDLAMEELRWELIIPHMFVVCIIGGLLMYTLRGRKK